MNDNQLKRRLNAIHYTPQVLAEMRQNIQRNELPGYGVTQDNQIEYLPTHQVITPRDEIPQNIKEIYDEYGVGSGIKNLYEKVSRHYIGIHKTTSPRILAKTTTNWLTNLPNKRIKKSNALELIKF
jgi:hypothetical protein